jgi:membrane associated rhomboid family serine protease
MDAHDRICARCGVTAPSVARRSVQRTLGLMLPTFHPASTVLLALNLLNLGVVLLHFGLNQLFKPDSVMLLTMGALDPYSFLQGEYWRIITYGFLHIGLLHILFNMMALSQVGPVLEREVGSARFLCVYMLSLLGGGAADVLVRGPVIMVIAGASGALFGLIGFGMTFAHFYGGPAGQAPAELLPAMGTLWISVRVRGAGGQHLPPGAASSPAPSWATSWNGNARTMRS